MGIYTPPLPPKTQGSLRKREQIYCKHPVGAENAGYFPHLPDGESNCEMHYLVYPAPSDTGGGRLAPLIVSKPGPS